MQMSASARRKKIEEYAAAADGERSSERLRLPWKTKEVICPVVELPLDLVVLNRRSHRIRAQLDAHPDRTAVMNDPEAPTSQRVLADLLRATEQYADLKANLKEERQRDPGVITREGVLVNANTRAVALGDLNARYIRVAVLPAGATEQEISELELRLQMKRDFKQNYTFTNQLLFVEELRSDYGYSAENISLMLGYALSSEKRELERGAVEVERSTRMLAMIRELQETSQRRIPLPFFDDKRVALLEVDTEYEKLKLTDPDRAVRLRATRLVGVLAELGYRDLRHIDDKFFDTYMVPALEDDPLLRDYVTTLTRGEGTGAQSELNLGALGTEDEDDARSADPNALLGWFAKSQGQKTIEIQPKTRSGARIQITREALVRSVATAVEQAVAEARTDALKEDKLTYPGRILSEVVRKIERVREAFRGIKRDPSFDLKKFQYRVNKTERALKRLRDEAGL